MTPIAQLVSSHAAEFAGYERRAAASQGAAVRLDPARVAKCRHTHFAGYYFSPKFLRLKASIERVGGNIDAIKVRTTDGGHEIVFGHARLQACLELGLPVSAIVEDMDDRELEFVVHQTFKSKPSPWRLGAVLAGALDTYLYPSLRRAASELGPTQTEVSMLIKLHRLPDAVKGRLSKVALTPASARRLVKQYESNPGGIGDLPKALRVLYPSPAA